MTHTITIRDGRLAFIFSDDLACLLPLGAATVERASAVEPAPFNGSIGWTAKLLDDGTVLGPYPTRQDALDAERDWLRANRGL